MLQIDKEEFTALILNGATVKDLQNKYGISRSSVYVYKNKWNLVGLGPHAKVRAADVGTKLCKICGETKDLQEFYSNGYAADGKKKYKPSCKKCENLGTRKTKNDKIVNVLEKFGKTYACERCGYDKNTAALCFHHLDPTKKDFEIAQIDFYPGADLEAEIDKCIVLCHNCHMEEHYPHLNK